MVSFNFSSCYFFNIKFYPNSLSILISLKKKLPRRTFPLAFEFTEREREHMLGDVNK